MIDEHREQRTGFIVALTTFVAWGFLAMYWKFLQEVPPLQILAHRLVNELGLDCDHTSAVVAWALGIATSAKAAGHLRGAPAQEYQAEAGSLRPETSQDLFGFVFPGLEATPQQRAALVAWQERYKAVLDCMGLCTLSSAWMDAELYHPEEIAALYSALTGIETSGEELMAYGERLNNLERAFNLLYAGFDRRHDYPPRRFMEESLQEGRYAGARLERGEWEVMLDAYYREHHWDEPTGRPCRSVLERHGLSLLAEQARDRLPA